MCVCPNNIINARARTTREIKNANSNGCVCVCGGGVKIVYGRFARYNGLRRRAKRNCVGVFYNKIYAYLGWCWYGGGGGYATTVANEL